MDSEIMGDFSFLLYVPLKFFPDYIYLTFIIRELNI